MAVLGAQVDERETPAGGQAIVGALAGARLLVAVAERRAAPPAALDEPRAPRRELDIATALAADGSLSLLAFSHLQAVERWDPSSDAAVLDARRLVGLALELGVQRLIIDPAGPASASLGMDELTVLAQEPGEQELGLPAGLRLKAGTLEPGSKLLHALREDFESRDDARAVYIFSVQGMPDRLVVGYLLDRSSSRAAFDPKALARRLEEREGTSALSVFGLDAGGRAVLEQGGAKPVLSS